MNQLKFLLLFIFALSFSQITWAQRGQSSKRFTAGAMIHTPVALFAGFNMKKFRLGINYEYNLAGQTADPASVSNQNLSGKGAAMGVRAEFYDGKQSFG